MAKLLYTVIALCVCLPCAWSAMMGESTNLGYYSPPSYGYSPPAYKAPSYPSYEMPSYEKPSYGYQQPQPSYGYSKPSYGYEKPTYYETYDTKVDVRASFKGF